MRQFTYLLLALLLSFCSSKSTNTNTTNKMQNIEVSDTTTIESALEGKIKNDQEELAQMIKGKKSLTIEDYYLALPDKYFFGCKSYKGNRYWGEITKNQRLRYIKHKNLPNGYLRAQLPNEQTPLQVALFTFGDKKVIAIFMDAGSMWQCTTRDFLTLGTNGYWEELNIELPIGHNTKSIENLEAKLKKESPMPLDRKVILPEYGTDLKVVDVSTETELFKIKWEGGSFKLK